MDGFIVAFHFYADFRMTQLIAVDEQLNDSIINNSKYVINFNQFLYPQTPAKRL